MRGVYQKVIALNGVMRCRSRCAIYVWLIVCYKRNTLPERLSY